LNEDFIIDSDEEEQQEKEQFSSRSPLKMISVENDDKNNGFDTFRKNCSP